MIYSIKCPQCRHQAHAHMTEKGSRGTYREVFVDYVCKKIICDHCGLFVNEGDRRLETIEYWFVDEFKGHRLWAPNLTYLNALIDWLEQKTPPRNVAFETLPKWLLADRKNVLRKLKRMREA